MEKSFIHLKNLDQTSPCTADMLTERLKKRLAENFFVLSQENTLYLPVPARFAYSSKNMITTLHSGLTGRRFVQPSQTNQKMLIADIQNGAVVSSIPFDDMQQAFDYYVRSFYKALDLMFLNMVNHPCFGQVENNANYYADVKWVQNMLTLTATQQERPHLLPSVLVPADEVLLETAKNLFEKDQSITVDQTSLYRLEKKGDGFVFSQTDERGTGFQEKEFSGWDIGAIYMLKKVLGFADQKNASYVFDQWTNY